MDLNDKFDFYFNNTKKIESELPKIKEKVELLDSNFPFIVENYFQKILLNKQLKDVEIKYNKVYIDFYKKYDGVKVHLIRLIPELPPNTTFLQDIPFLNFNLLSYKGSNSKDWEYQKLYDIGILSINLYKNKEKLLKKLNILYKKYVVSRNKQKDQYHKTLLKAIKYAKKSENLIIQQAIKNLKTSFLDFTPLCDWDGNNIGYFPNYPIDKKINNIVKNITSIKLLKGSKYKLLITTTELDKKNNPIVWEVECNNLQEYISSALLPRIALPLLKFLLNVKK